MWQTNRYKHELATEHAALVAEVESADGSDIDALEARVVNLTKRVEAATACQSFEMAVEQVRKRDECSHTDALRTARLEHPALFEDYQATGVASAPISKSAHTPEAVRRFEARVNEIASRDRVSRLVALERARSEYPEDFSRYQQA